MAPRKLNVLVYTGIGTTIASVRQCLYTLRRLLSPNYAVIPLTEAALLKEPWAPTCALLVIPGGADMGYCRVLNGTGNRIITAFVRRGGAYVGFCAGGYYGCSRCEFEIGHEKKGMEVVGSRELAFFPGTCRGGAFKGFEYQSEKGARAVKVKVERTAFSSAGVLPVEFMSYFNGGGVFVDAASMTDKKVEVLASYDQDIAVDGGEGKAALVYCKVGEGSAILTGPHPEFSAVNLEPQPDIAGYSELITTLAEDEDRRINFLKACLTKLGLEVSQDSSLVPSLSKLHLSALDRREVGSLVTSFGDIITKDEGSHELIKGENDTFHLEHPDSRWSVREMQDALKNAQVDGSTETVARRDPARELSVDGVIDYNKVVKTVVSHEDAWPEPKETPYFNHNDFYCSLQEYRRKESEAYEWGDVLMYGEVVTSTNTLLEKNPKLLSKLPTGFTLAATTQIAGRGRGTNVWVAPPGSLIMSTVINHPAHISSTRPIVFIQYLAAIAIVEAIQGFDKGYENLPVKLKWPNDIYARDPASPTGDDGKPNYVKIGGILTNCSYSAGNYQLVLGIGINTTNGRPTTSLDALLSTFAKGQNLSPFRIERLLARLLTRLETLYRAFMRDGFTRGLEERYYGFWLHTNQLVTLESEGGVKARVVGITRDWGLLMAQELGFDERPTGRVWSLQSDENSFDFWKGLVKRKI